MIESYSRYKDNINELSEMFMESFEKSENTLRFNDFCKWNDLDRDAFYYYMKSLKPEVYELYKSTKVNNKKVAAKLLKAKAWMFDQRFNLSDEEIMEEYETRHDND
jgi:predicted RNA-binding protein (virulence factor B family)